MGFAHGMGQFINTDGYIYSGEFMSGLKHGCGEVRDLSRYLFMVRQGVSSYESWYLCNFFGMKVMRGT